MKIKLVESKAQVTFSSEEEKSIIYDLIERHIDLMPKVYRKRNANWMIVADMTSHGRGYSMAICRALDVDPYGIIWTREDEPLVCITYEENGA